MSQFIANKNMLIHKDCIHLIEQIQSYAWDSKAADKGEDKPIKLNDHSVDSCRYLLASVFKHGLNNAPDQNLTYDQIRARVSGYDSLYDSFNQEISAAGGMFF